MKFENTEVWGFEHALRGMRNPKNSWNRSDSETWEDNTFVIGENDMILAKTLIKAGSEHRKFMRQIFVSVDITAPLYWWKEFDTYKVGTVANSTSTMHKLASKPITLECFEVDDYQGEYTDTWNVFVDSDMNGYPISLHNSLVEPMIKQLEKLRQKYLETKDKRYWKELIRWLPESWLQTRTVTLNYENIYSIIRHRQNHKLNEWSGMDSKDLPNFISWAESLPYANDLLFLDLNKE